MLQSSAVGMMVLCRRIFFVIATMLHARSIMHQLKRQNPRCAGRNARKWAGLRNALYARTSRHLVLSPRRHEWDGFSCGPIALKQFFAISVTRARVSASLACLFSRPFVTSCALPRLRVEHRMNILGFKGLNTCNHCDIG